jgi:hypothetical protein
MGDQVGILAAVTQAQVPIANPRGQVPIDQRAIAGLRGALFAELDHVLSIAAPSGTLDHLLGAAAGAEAPDALDELLARAAADDDTDQEDA